VERVSLTLFFETSQTIPDKGKQEFEFFSFQLKKNLKQNI